MFVSKPIFQPPTEEMRHLPECPRWLRNYPGSSTLLGWVTIQHGPDRQDGSIHIFDWSTGRNRTFDLSGRPGFFVETTEPGVVLIGLERRLVLFDLLRGELREPGILVTRDERVIINDGIAIPGGVIFGTKDLAFHDPIATLYHFDCNTRHLSTIMGGQFCSNGKYFYRDANSWTLVDIDSTPKSIVSYRLSESLDRIISRHPIVRPDSLPAIPDGLCATPDGTGVIVAFFNPAATADGIAQQIRLADGEVENEWKVPGSPRVTRPELVRMNGEVCLILTTAVEGMSDEIRAMAPEAGSLFVAPTPFHDVPPDPPLPLTAAFSR
ncbi:MAG: SMP-30/gluconolactonase/LRE family protein [Acidobacteriaceae bacterium]|nr:SMP-30/gluconolactonase/LRE family protein [Acidobacteriaceae bacterium]